MVLAKPNPIRRTGWRARFTDPDTGRQVWETLDPSLTTAETRADWAVKKSKALAKRRLELESGAHRATGTSLEKAIGRFFEDQKHELRERTRQIYEQAAGKLKAWAATADVKSGDDLTGPKLVDLRATLVKAPKRAKARGGTRGEMKATVERRAATTINIELRAIKTILGYLRRLGLLARLSSDDIRDNLKKVATGTDAGDPLQRKDIHALLDAAIAHVAVTFKATRKEHAARAAGSTTRYESIAPIIVVALLTGMRRGEILDLKWERVDLEGRLIRLRKEDTKTKMARDIDLDVSPAVVDLLKALRPENAKGPVWTMSREAIKAAVRRLPSFDAPVWTWQRLRETCGSWLTCAPSIFRASSAYMSAARLGHSVAVAERFYVGAIRGISPDAKTLEAAMQIEPHVARVVDAARTFSGK